MQCQTARDGHQRDLNPESLARESKLLATILIAPDIRCFIVSYESTPRGSP